MVEIQADEYGGGSAERMHSELFAGMMRDLGLDAAYGALWDEAPAVAFTSVNTMSLFGLNRRWRGAAARPPRRGRDDLLASPAAGTPPGCAGSASTSGRRSSTTSTSRPTPSTSRSPRWTCAAAWSPSRARPCCPTCSRRGLRARHGRRHRRALLGAWESGPLGPAGCLPARCRAVSAGYSLRPACRNRCRGSGPSEGGRHAATGRRDNDRRTGAAGRNRRGRRGAGARAGGARRRRGERAGRPPPDHARPGGALGPDVRRRVAARPDGAFVLRVEDGAGAPTMARYGPADGSRPAAPVRRARAARTSAMDARRRPAAARGGAARRPAPAWRFLPVVEAGRVTAVLEFYSAANCPSSAAGQRSGNRSAGSSRMRGGPPWPPRSSGRPSTTGTR